MPIVSRIGSRSWRVRALYGAIFAVLILGAATMLYPFALMLAGSVKSEADASLITPYPEFWFDDALLFRKYAESKHNAALDLCRQTWNQSLPNWRFVTAPPSVPDDARRDFLAWRATPAARDMGILGHTTGARLLPHNARRYRRRMHARCDGDLARYRELSGTMAASWASVAPPFERVGRYRHTGLPAALRDDFRLFKLAAPGGDMVLLNPEGLFVRAFLVPQYGPDVAAYNRRHGTDFAGYEEIRLPRRAPAAQPARAEWERFVRDTLPLECLRLDAAAEVDFRRYVERRRRGANDEAARRGLPPTAPAATAFVRRLDEAPALRVVWEEFVKQPDACPLEHLEIYGPAEMFAEYRSRRADAATSPTPPLGALIADADYRDCAAAKSAWRREFTLRNYQHVLSYLALHGNGFRNTLIYCALAILTALLVNPLAAYALSRFQLPGAYKILLFCMATMAFPGEVSMIPSFILMKRFPLWPLLGGVTAAIAAFLALERLAPRWPERWRSLAALATGLFTGVVALPLALGAAGATVSLLNTFAALVIPGAANGYFIFLLKGFFDSLPRELYEAAELDGAGEWTKFWMLTMNLSRPILAVIALGAFTSAYSAFMMALIIIPDQRMWTIMVWIYQLQSQAHGAVVYASLVLAALPTFLVFACCQNVIIRGIVVPTEK